MPVSLWCVRVEAQAMSRRPKLRFKTFLFLTAALFSCFQAVTSVKRGHRTTKKSLLRHHKAKNKVFDRISGLQTEADEHPLSSEFRPPGNLTFDTNFSTSLTFSSLSDPPSQGNQLFDHFKNESNEEPRNLSDSSDSTLQSDSPVSFFQPDLPVSTLQSDSPGSERQGVRGHIYFPSSEVTDEWQDMRPLVQCSGAAMILKAKGRSYPNLLVDRESATPVSVLQLPSYCGYNVKSTWREMVLMAPYDGCYIIQQNGSYVLPLLWWGRPVKVSCPMTADTLQSNPSGFCSQSGMAIKLSGPIKNTEKFYIKVNEEWVPLESDTCAFLVNLPPELILFIPFTASCAQNGNRTFNVLLDGSEYVLSCHLMRHLPPLPKQHHHTLFLQPLHPPSSQTIPLEVIPSKIHTPQLPKGADVQPSDPMKPPRPVQVPLIVQPTPVPKPAQDPAQLVQDPQPAQPTAVSPPLAMPPFQPPIEPHQHMHHPHHHHFNYPPHSYIYPYYPPFYDQKHGYTHDTHHAPIPWWPQAPQFPFVPQEPIFPLVPDYSPPAEVPQTTQEPQLPSRFPVFPNASSKMSPSLTCTGDHLVVELPSAKTESIKVKDVKKNVWVLLTSAPGNCGYSVQRKGKGAVFSSPIPACHSHVVKSSSRIALHVKFWNPSLQKHHVLQLQCPYSLQSPPPTTTRSPALHIEPISIIVPKPTSPARQPWPNNQEPPPPPVPFNPTVTTLDLSEEIQPSSWLHEDPPLPHGHGRHKPQVQCHSQEMTIRLPPGPIVDLMVQTPLGSKNNIKAMILEEAPSHCGYIIKKNQHGRIILHLPYKSCHMDNQDGQYQIILTYQSADGRSVEALLSCQVPSSHECNLPTEQRLPCGPTYTGAAECRELGCCFCKVSSICYYPMDECTSDRHFVFSIPATLTDPPLLPALLVAAGNTSCTPQRVVKGLALFKVPLDGCGAHKYEVGKTVIYMLEILNKLQSLSLNYGTITRDSPFRLLVECRYLPGTVASVGYLVKSPSLGPSIQAQGVFGVQLRIAKDQQYSSYYPQYHRPLRKLLGKPLYLEVRLLNPPDYSAVLLVHYCVAYPRSAQSAWVLIYDGCPNPLDVISTHEPPLVPAEAVANHVRRFTVNTFQFLQSDGKDDDPGEEEEEIYFMCATEVCLPSEGPCVEGCFDRSDDIAPATFR